MASAALLACTFISFFLILSSANLITHEACKASRDPPACESTLSNSHHVPSSSGATIPQVIQAALKVSFDNLKKGRTMVWNLKDSFSGERNGTRAAKSCLHLLRYSNLRLASSEGALDKGDLKDARAWASAALGYQYDCLSALKNVNTMSLVGSTMAFLNNSLISSTSSALGMMVNYDLFGEETGSWAAPKTERDGFWEISSGSTNFAGFKGGVPRGLIPDVTVCKGDGCNCQTVQEAVNAAPNNSDSRFVIWIKAGLYEEMVRIPFNKRNVVFLGDGMGKTVITGSRNVGHQPGMTTFNTATVGVDGDGFMASYLTIQNTAGPDSHQAVAFRSDSDLSILENCEFIGNQDTLYVHSLRQYYKSCLVQGNIDFIFGFAAAFFQDCKILIAPRQNSKPEKEEKDAVAAHGRMDPSQSTGFVFQNCVVNGTDAYMASYYSNPKVHMNYLGRPWKMYSRTVFIGCTLEALISPQGWMPWDGTDFALNTLYYGEFGNNGSGSDTSKRVSWSGRIPPEHVLSYSVENFIQGDRWIPVENNGGIHFVMS